MSDRRAAWYAYKVARGSPGRPYNPAEHGAVRNSVTKLNRLGLFNQLVLGLLFFFIGPVVWALALKGLWKNHRTMLIVSTVFLIAGYLLLIPSFEYNLTEFVLPMIVLLAVGYTIFTIALFRGPKVQVRPNSGIPASNPYTFEDQVARVFQTYGYKVVQTPYQGDHGVDIKVFKDNEFGVVQCKRYAGGVGEPAIRDFFGAMQHENADVGYFVTTGHFTAHAYAWARGKKLVLIDGDALAKMLEETATT